MKKKLLLFVCGSVVETGHTSYHYIFKPQFNKNRNTEAFDTYVDQCDGGYGFIQPTNHETQKWVIHARGNGETGFVMSAPITDGNAEKIKKLVDEYFPEAFTLLCSKETADAIIPQLSKFCQVDALYTDDQISTS